MLTRRFPWLMILIPANALLCLALAYQAVPPLARSLAPAPAQAWAQQPAATDVRTRSFIYKRTPEAELRLDIYYPGSAKAADRRPAVIYFFGGGWYRGDRAEFAAHARYFAARGLIAACADYRVWTKHNTDIAACLEDARSAIRYLRKYSGRLGIDPRRVAASGGSAGGHLAIATALCSGFDAADDDLSVSARPDALVLYYPVLNMHDRAHYQLEYMPGDTEEARRQSARRLSPIHQLGRDLPPTLIFYGDTDYLLPMGFEFLRRADRLNHKVELRLAPDQWHGFVHRTNWQDAALHYADRFLTSLGWLEGDPLTPLAPDTEMPLARPTQTADPQKLLYGFGYAPEDYQWEE